MAFFLFNIKVVISNNHLITIKMRIFLILICFTGLGPIFISAQNSDSLFMDAALKKMHHSKSYTIDVLKLMPENKYAFKPNINEMDFGEQAFHLSSNLGWLISSYLKVSKNPVIKPIEKNKNELLSITNKAYDYAIDVLAHFDRNKLTDTVSFFAGPMTKLQIINLINDHQTHHRAQMIVYLRLNGIKPPEYIGW